MEIKHNPKHTNRAQSLRRDATRQERHLWYDFLNKYPLRFRRQVTIDQFIVDFYCAKAKLVIEVDGSQHYEENGLAYDKERSAVLSGYGIYVLRFTNREIDNDFNSVCNMIHNKVLERTGCENNDQL